MMRGLQEIMSRSRAGSQRGITLIELMVSLIVLSIISTMVLMGWFSLSRSYSFSINSADARDFGRQAIGRVQREIRDAQKPPSGYLSGSASSPPDAIIYRARPYSITFATTFNEAGNDVMTWVTPPPVGGVTPPPYAAPSKPHLVIYRLYRDGELWRYEDGGSTPNGVIANVNLNYSYPTDLTDAATQAEQANGEGHMLILKNVVNWTAPNPPKPAFMYNHFDSNGALHSDDMVLGTDRYDIIATQIELLVDLNPRRAPLYADLVSTAELRNAR